MIELKSIKQIPVRKVERISKQWKIAEKKSCCNDRNSAVEVVYHGLIEKAKKLFATLPDEYSRTYIERDYKQDHSTPLAMHLYQTPWFSLSLSCGLSLWYTIHYDFYCCPFENELNAIFQKQMIDYPNQVIRSRMQTPVEEIFRKRLFSEDKDYIDTLEYDRKLAETKTNCLLK